MPARAKTTATTDDAASRPDYRVGALAKGLRVLALFDERRPTWTVRDIADTTGFPMPTTYRLVMTLLGEGYLDQLPSGAYRPSVRCLTLGSSALRGLDLVEAATPELQRLADETGETVNLAVLDDEQILYLVRLRNADLVTANIQVGSRLPADRTSIGKLLSASPGDLARGWAFQDEELAPGLRSIAAPIHGSDGQVLAGINIAVQAGEWTMDRLVEELLPALRATAAKITQILGADDGE